MKTLAILFLLLAALSNVRAVISFDYEPATNGLENRVVLSQDRRALTIHWNNGGFLEASESINGPWARVGRSSGIHRVNNFNSPDSGAQYFRVVNQDRPSFTRPAGQYHIPNSYLVDTERRYPLIVNLHYFTSLPADDFLPYEGLERYTPMLHLVDEKEFIYLTPHAAFHEQAIRGAGWVWNATEQCCIFDRQGRVFIDDQAYIMSSVDFILANYPNIDRDRIYVMGGANGGTMAMDILCQNSDVFAAGVGVNTWGWSEPTDCSPKHSVHVLRIDATNDGENVYRGGTVFQGYTKTGNAISFTTAGAIQEFANWAKRMNCGELTSWENGVYHMDLRSDVPDTDVVAYTDCDATVEHWRINGGNLWLRVWDGDRASDFSEAVYDWLIGHPKVR